MLSQSEQKELVTVAFEAILLEVTTSVDVSGSTVGTESSLVSSTL